MTSIHRIFFPDHLMRWAAALVIGLCCIACDSSTTSFINEDDQLRRENLALRGEVAKLKETLVTERSTIDTLRQLLDERASRPEISTALFPQLSRIEFDRFSGPVATRFGRRVCATRGGGPSTETPCTSET